MKKYITYILIFMGLLQYANAQSPVKSTFTKEHNGFWLHINDQKQYTQIGIVYQPTTGEQHINEYKDKLSTLFSALLPESKGGKGHGERFQKMGIDLIRVYELPTTNKQDIDSIKQIFNFVYENYNIRFLIGDYAGLYSGFDWTGIGWGMIMYKEKGYLLTPSAWDMINSAYRKVDRHVELLVKAYCKEKWLLGWQIGNENNYYTAHGVLKEKIPYNLEYYYTFMDYYASKVRKELIKHGVQQFIALGQGDLTWQEAIYISRMKNIDAIGINCYRSLVGKDSLGELIRLTKIHLDKPIYFSEFGMTTFSDSQQVNTQQKQSDYLQQVSQFIFSNSSGRNKESNIFAAFIHEATDEKWKTQEHGKKGDAEFGILGKVAEKELGKWISRTKDFQKVIPENDAPENLLASCWSLLQGDFAKKHGPAYGDCIANADKLISIYQSKADSQQLNLVNYKLSFEKGANDSLWALNAVGTGFFIKGRCKYEIASNILGAGQKDNAKIFFDEAKKDFEYVTTQYPYAHIRGINGEYYNIKEAIRKIYPELSEPYLKFNLNNAIIFVLLPFLLITHFFRTIILYFLKLFKVNRKSVISNISILNWKQKTVFCLLLLGQLSSLFYFILYWYHPIRLEFYTVNPYLYWLLTAIGLTSILFYLYIWYILWAMKKPIYIEPEVNLKCAMVTTFVKGEPIDMLEKTLKSMIEVEYQHDVYLLDETNGEDVKEICRKTGAVHFSRFGKESYNTVYGQFQRKTKGGNLNSWIDSFGSNYEFVTFLDPDHAPYKNFLHRVLGYFKDPEVGFVQAPQIFNNHAENFVAQGASEQSYFFFGPIQQGLYGLGSCMLNGSHTTLRMKAIEKIGAYAVHDADDVLTSIRLKVRGFKGVHIPEVIASGLAPNTMVSFLKQQKRWAASVFNLMVYHYPFYTFRYGWNQALTYYVFTLFYLMGAFFSILVLLPIVSIISNQAIVNANFFEFVSKFAPFLLFQYLILVPFGQQFMIRGGSKKGFWYRGGFLWVGSWYHFIQAIVSGVFKKKVRDREITPKESKKSKTNLKYQFYPHLLIVILSIGTLFYSLIYSSSVKETRGMQFFLVVNIILQGAIYYFGSKKEKEVVAIPSKQQVENQ